MAGRERPAVADADEKRTDSGVVNARAAGTAPGGSATALELSHVRFSYDGGTTWALNNISLSVAAGERLCILGANGSGKSTLAHILAGLEAPDQGTVTLLGKRCFDGANPDGEAYGWVRHHTGMVFQVPEDQMVTTRVADDVAFGPENLCVEPTRISQLVEQSLARVGMSAYADADPALLSGGQQQRVALAGALAMEPQLLVLDEAGARLDVRGRRAIMKLLAELQGAHTIVQITHFMDEALLADRVIVLDHGTIAAEGTPHEVLHRTDKLLKLGLEAPFAAQVAHGLSAYGVSVQALTLSELTQALLALRGGRA